MGNGHLMMLQKKDGANPALGKAGGTIMLESGFHRVSAPFPLDQCLSQQGCKYYYCPLNYPALLPVLLKCLTRVTQWQQHIP